MCKARRILADGVADTLAAPLHAPALHLTGGRRSLSSLSTCINPLPASLSVCSKRTEQPTWSGLLFFTWEEQSPPPWASRPDCPFGHFSFRLFQASPSVPAKYVEDKEKMLSRTLQLVELADETWLVTGRHPLPVITAATFLAWQSLQPSHRLTCSLARFCKLANVDLPYPASSRLQELLSVLLRMAERLAWLQVLKLDKRSVVKHIGDLLQHRHTLVRKAFRDGTAEMEAGEKELRGRCQGPEQGKEEVASSSLDLPEGKRPASPTPLLPPCMLKPPKRICPPPPVSTVTGDENISDSEIEQYLRTPQEIKDFEKAQAARQTARSVSNPP